MTPDPYVTFAADGSVLAGAGRHGRHRPDGSTLIGNAGNTLVKDMWTALAVATPSGGLIGNAGNTAAAAGGSGLVAVPGGQLVARGGS